MTARGGVEGRGGESSERMGVTERLWRRLQPSQHSAVVGTRCMYTNRQSTGSRTPHLVSTLYVYVSSLYSAPVQL